MRGIPPSRLSTTTPCASRPRTRATATSTRRTERRRPHRPVLRKVMPGQLWPIPGNCGPRLADFFGADLVDHGPDLASYGPTSINISPRLADSGQLRGCWSNLSRVWAQVARFRPDSTGVASTSAEFGQDFRLLVAISTGFWPDVCKHRPPFGGVARASCRNAK